VLSSSSPSPSPLPHFGGEGRVHELSLRRSIINTNTNSIVFDKKGGIYGSVRERTGEVACCEIVYPELQWLMIIGH
jgi:hypothetical protein